MVKHLHELESGLENISNAYVSNIYELEIGEKCHLYQYANTENGDTSKRLLLMFWWNSNQEAIKYITVVTGCIKRVAVRNYSLHSY